MRFQGKRPEEGLNKIDLFIKLWDENWNSISRRKKLLKSYILEKGHPNSIDLIFVPSLFEGFKTDISFYLLLLNPRICSMISKSIKRKRSISTWLQVIN